MLKKIPHILSAIILILGLLPPLGVPAGIVQAQEDGSGMPGWPSPLKPIPTNEVGQVSRATSYTSTVQVENEAGTLETVELTGVDAMAADGVDPLAGNYHLVNWDTLLSASSAGNELKLGTYKAELDDDPKVLTLVTGSEVNLGAFPHNDITSADINNDGQSEQIAAYLGADNHVYLTLGETPGALGRATSKPAVALHEDGSMDLLVRGYDEALWHNHYDGSTWGGWNNDAGGLLLSAPAVASHGDGSFDVFALGSDNLTYHRSWNGSSWSGTWAAVDNASDWPAPAFWVGPTPEWNQAAAVVNGSGLELFRLGADNTLRWNHSPDGINWYGWQNLGGMLASAPAVYSPAADRLQVFARGVDNALWFRNYNAGWGEWLRAGTDGLTAGLAIDSVPAVDTSGNVYVRATDKKIWSTSCGSSGCGSWSLFGAPAVGDSLSPGVAIGSGDWQVIARVEDGGLMYTSDGLAWSDFAGLPTWVTSVDTGLIGIAKPWGGYQDYSIRLEPGNFLGNGRLQAALAYYSASDKVNIAIFAFGERFQPVKVTEQALTPTVGAMDMVVGDFVDGDGIDDVAFAYQNSNTYDLDILKVTTTGLSVVTSADLETVTIPDEDGDDYEYGYFTGTIQLAAGDLDADGQDEVASILVFNQIDWIYLTVCDSYIFSTRMRVHDVLKNPATNQYKLKVNYVGKDNWGAPGAWWGEAIYDEYDTPREELGLAIAIGDVDMDGKDDLVRTWPEYFANSGNSCGGTSQPSSARLVRKLQVVKFPVNPDKYTNTWDPSNDGIVATAEVIKVDEVGWSASYMDRIAIGDLNRDFKNEIAWQLWKDNYQLRTFYRDPYDSVDPYKNLADTKALDAPTYPILKAGNFTWEGIRVGRPTYRVQNRVDTLLSVINMPPKHRDLVKNDLGQNVLILSPNESCSPSPDSPSCTHAKYASQDFQSSEETLTTKRAYTISSELTVKGCIGGGADEFVSAETCVKASVGYTHGNNFEKTTTAVNSINFRRKVIAATDDKIVYFGTPYGVWEYPVLTGSSEAPGGFITIAFPLVTMTQFPSTSGGYNNGFCDESWYHGGHQPNNIWSYDPFGEIRFEDYDQNFVPVYDVIEGDWAEGAITYAHLQSVKTSQEYTHAVSSSLENETKIESKTKVVNMKSSIKLSVKGNYSTSTLNTDTVQTTTSTEYSYFISPQPVGSQYNTRVLFYWAEGGYQVMDYQTEPSLAVNWTIYNKPDPAFILPWYGFPDPSAPQPPPCGDSQKLYSPDIVIESYDAANDEWFPVTTAQPGDNVRLTATVRNFSNEAASNVLLRFYQGDPVNNNMIGEKTLPSLARVNGAQKVSVMWTVSGVGKQKIYAVLDPNGVIHEVHDDDDLINNNVGYGSLIIGNVAYSDMGGAGEQPYDAVTYKMSESGPVVSFYMPRASQTAVTRFEVKDTDTQVPVVGKVFQVVAYQGSQYRGWNEPITNFNLRPEADDPPAVIGIDFSGMTLPDDITLWRWTNFGWMPANCSGIGSIPIPASNLLFVPICQTGIFAYSETTPPLFTGIPLVVQSILREDPDPTSAASVSFKVTFSDKVTGVDSADFDLTSSGSLSGSAVTGVSGSGAAYIVSVSTGSGSGTLRLDIPVTATINDLSSNPLSGLPYQGGEMYTITGSSFADVPNGHWAKSWIERLFAAGITAGCATNPLVYCPDNPVTRAQMAVFLERGMNGAGYVPPTGTGTLYDDVPLSHWAVDWIEKLAADGITNGCNTTPHLYCPEQEVTRDQMAVFLLRAIHGAGYIPPEATGIFSDVPIDHWAAAFIEQLFAEGITAGCVSSPMLYCPAQEVTRAQMAVFLVKAFNLP